jgi:glycosyltransferase involved in cell wall biosynthesis
MPDVTASRGVRGRDLRVAFLVWRLAPTGGIPRFQADLLSALAQRPGLDLHLISVRPLIRSDRLERFDRIATLHSLELDGPATFRKRLVSLARLRRLLAFLRPDVLHVHSGIGWLPAPLRRTGRVVLQVHDPPQTVRNSRLTDAIERIASTKRGWVLVVDSRMVAAQLSQAWDVPTSSIEVAHLGIDTDEHAPDLELRRRSRESLELSDDEVAIVYLCRLVDSKQPMRFAELAARDGVQVPNARFLLAGTGPLERTAREVAATSQGRLEVLGEVPSVREFLAAGDVFFSTSEAEGFGLAVAEAMSMGLPVVAFDAAGLRDLIVEGRTGFVVPFGDDRRAVDLLTQLAGDQSARCRLGAAARSRMLDEFTLAAMADRYTALWLDAVAGGEDRTDP